MIYHDCEFTSNPESGKCDGCIEIAEEKLSAMQDMYDCLRTIVRSHHLLPTNDLQYLLDDFAKVSPYNEED